MIVNYDTESEATYIEIVPGAKIAKTVSISDLVMVDVDDAGKPVGVEFVMRPNQITDMIVKTVVMRFESLDMLFDRTWLYAAS
jgi:uncharacterized protein YuzE